MMKCEIKKSKQAGVALVLSLLILLVLTVIGVAAMNSTIMQERMAGNAKTQADSFEKSSEGVSRALELFYDQAGALPVLNDSVNTNDLACGQLFEQYDLFDPDSAEAWSYPSGTTWHPASAADDNPKLEQRMYCCQSWTEVELVDADGSTSLACVENPSKLFVLNRATFVGSGADGNDRSLAVREIEVELAESEPDDPTCAICVPGDIGGVSGPTSAGKGSFRVSGSCGAAVVTQGNTNAGTFKSGIDDNVIGKFEGGVEGTDDMGSPWNDPAALAEFLFWAKLGLPLGSSSADAAVGESNVRGLYINTGGTYSDNGTNSYGTVANPQITYIDGNADFGGNISGAGIMIVRGTLKWGGTPNFNGLLVSLGGGFNVGGGGGGGNPSGSMVITELTSSNARDLFGRDVLHYEVAMNATDQEVKMYNPADYGPGDDVRKADSSVSGFGGGGTDAVPARPILVDSNVRELIHYDYGTADPTDDRFFLASDGSEVTDLVSMAGNNFEFVDPADGTTVLATMEYRSDPTRDAFGRLIPEFVLSDNYPDDYGYNPNQWSWDGTLAGDAFDWGSSDFDWKGGGNQNFTYDCQTLQRVKHKLLCAQPIEDDLPSGSDDFYKDPESQIGDYCWHVKAGVDGGSNGSADGKYFEDYATTTPPTAGRPENQKAWHMWSPSCDCLGISAETDMIISGWRENLGWRDDQEFQGCAALPTKNSC
jgi:hypothetical protein